MKPKAIPTPRKPIPCWTWLSVKNSAARTALPQPPNTSQNVPRNSAPSLATRDRSRILLLRVVASRPPIPRGCPPHHGVGQPRRHQRPNSVLSDPPVTNKAETVVILSRRLSPFVRLDLRERDIPGRFQIDFGDLQGLQSVPRRAIDLAAAGDEDRGRSKITSESQSLLQEWHGAHVVAPPRLVASDDESGTARQRPADRVVGLATHDQHLSSCEVSKPPPVTRNAPRDVLTVADHSVAGNRRNPDDHRLSDCNRGSNTRVGIVRFEGDVGQREVVDLFNQWIQDQLRQRAWLPSELQLGLINMVAIQVGIAQGVHEVADAQAAHLSDHVGQQRI